jgi:hypothetical protein
MSLRKGIWSRLSWSVALGLWTWDYGCIYGFSFLLERRFPTHNSLLEVGFGPLLVKPGTNALRLALSNQQIR